MSAHVTDEHREEAVRLAGFRRSPALVAAIAQAIADAEARGRAEVSVAAMTSGGTA